MNIISFQHDDVQYIVLQCILKISIRVAVNRALSCLAHSFNYKLLAGSPCYAGAPLDE